MSVDYSKQDEAGTCTVHGLRERHMAELQEEFMEGAARELGIALATLETWEFEIACLRYEMSHATLQGCEAPSKGWTESLSPLPSSSHSLLDTSGTGSNPGRHQRS